MLQIREIAHTPRDNEIELIEVSSDDEDSDNTDDNMPNVDNSAAEDTLGDTRNKNFSDAPTIQAQEAGNPPEQETAFNQ